MATSHLGRILFILGARQPRMATSHLGQTFIQIQGTRHCQAATSHLGQIFIQAARHGQPGLSLRSQMKARLMVAQDMHFHLKEEQMLCQILPLFLQRLLGVMVTGLGWCTGTMIGWGCPSAKSFGTAPARA